MNKRIYTTVISVLMVIFLVSLVSSANIFNTCQTYNQKRPMNQINSQIQHFTCCDGNRCDVGDGLRKHINLQDVQDYMAYGTADINVYNYDDLDKINVVLRTGGLPKNQLFTAWILQGEGSRSKIGAFKTNSKGKGYLVFKQTLSGEFNKYHTLVVEDGNSVRYLSANINFKDKKIQSK